MSAVSETIVREFFEVHGFFIHQQRKYVAPAQREEEEIDFLVLNPDPHPGKGNRPFILTTADLPEISRAVVAVKGWHTEIFSSAFLASTPEIFRFTEPAATEAASSVFAGDGPLLKILVVSALPQSTELRNQSIEVLRSKGIDAVILFPTILADLILQTEANRNYQKSDILQVIRLLKNYDFLKGPQLELFRSKKK